jgi:hypothetical protein
VAYQLGNRLWVASAGDSRAILCSCAAPGSTKLIARPLTLDHRPRRLSERLRVEAAGGRVQPKQLPSGRLVGEPRVWLQQVAAPGLLLSRSLGDLMAATVGCTSEPEISYVTLEPERDQFVVLASDGVWDVLTNEQVGHALQALCVCICVCVCVCFCACVCVCVCLCVRASVRGCVHECGCASMQVCEAVPGWSPLKAALGTEQSVFAATPHCTSAAPAALSFPFLSPGCHAVTCELPLDPHARYVCWTPSPKHKGLRHCGGVARPPCGLPARSGLCAVRVGGEDERRQHHRAGG